MAPWRPPEEQEKGLPIREIILLRKRDEELLQSIIDEVHSRTNIRLDRSTVVRTLIEAFARMGLKNEDIAAVYRTYEQQSDLAAEHESTLAEIRQIEVDLQLALIEQPAESVVTREYRRELRDQRKRLKAIERTLAQEKPGR
jgi:hypothetical protein